METQQDIGIERYGPGREPDRSDRWYVPLVLCSAALFALLVGLLAVAEVLLNDAVADPHAAWRAPIERAEEAVRRGDAAAARRLWPAARGAALRSRDWDAMVAVGDLALRLETTGAARRDVEARAREAYLMALLRARAQGSLDGVLRVAQAFEALGDAQVLAQVIEIAEAVAATGPDPTGLERVRRLADRWSARAPEAGHAAPSR